MSAAPTSAPAAPPASIWRSRPFVILSLTAVVTGLGMKVYELALPLILYRATHSAVPMATMRAVEFLPNLLLAMFIGVLVDRMNKQRFTLAVTALQSLLLFGLFALHRLGLASLWVYYPIGFTLMMLGYAYGNARVSIVKYTLPNELLTAANAQFSSVSTLIGIMGPAISGFILMMADLHDGLLITAVTFAITCAAQMLLDSSELQARAKNGTFWQDLQDGWGEFRRNRPLFLITILVIFINATAGMYDAMVVFFAEDRLHLSSSALGLVLAIAGVGGLVGARLITTLRRRFRTGHLLAVTIFGMAVAYGIMFVAQSVVVMGLALFLEGMLGTIQNVCIWTFRQETTPPEMIGRVSGITGSIFKVGMVFTIFGSGWIADGIGPSYVFLGAAIANLVITLVYRRSALWSLA